MVARDAAARSGKRVSAGRELDRFVFVPQRDVFGNAGDDRRPLLLGQLDDLASTSRWSAGCRCRPIRGSVAPESRLQRKVWSFEGCSDRRTVAVESTDDRRRETCPANRRSDASDFAGRKYSACADPKYICDSRVAEVQGVAAGVAWRTRGDASVKNSFGIEVKGGPAVRVNGDILVAPEAPGVDGRRYAVLDALRFVLALWVTVGHYEMFPLFAGVNGATPVGRFLIHAWQSIVFGTPAVIVFFVISGFCIHLPYRGDKKMDVGRYYLRRYTRILIPVAAALGVYRFVGQHFVFWGEHSILWQSPLWSLLCEEIYYAAYPPLRKLRGIVSWERVIPVAFAVSVGVAAMHRHAMSWHDYGPLGTAVILLPVWLLGCLLAEKADALQAQRTEGGWRIWLWRFGVWFASWVTEMLHFKAHLPLTQTMAWFGVIAYLWVKNEIARGKTRAPSRVLVWAGLWSYSLYLVHAQAPDLWYALNIQNAGPRLTWCGVIVSSLVGAYLFYLVAERPSHQLARWIGRMRPGAPSVSVGVGLHASSIGDGSGVSAGAVGATTI